MSKIPKTWTLSLSEPWFSFVKMGRKLYEGRLYRGLIPYINPGDTIEFYCSDKIAIPVTVRVVDVVKYSSFRDALSRVHIPSVLPGVRDVEAGEKIYLQFASAELQKRNQVVMISILHADIVADAARELASTKFW